MTRKSPLPALALAFILLASGLFLLPAPAAAEQWAKVDMGKPYGGAATNGLFGAAVGDGDRNNHTEVYFSCDDDGHVYRFNYTGGAWNRTDVGPIQSGNPWEQHARAILVGDGDDDATTEVYVNGLYRQNWWNNLVNRLYQFVYSGGTWTRTDCGATGSRSNDLALGDGNNDDRKEIFSADQDGHMYMYYKSNDWSTQDMGNPPRFWYQNQWNTANLRGVAVGDGDNNGYLEVYGTTSNSYLYKYNYSSSTTSWNITEAGTGDNDGTGNFYTQGLTRVVVGDGDNDGKNEVYATGYINASVYRFSYNSSSSKWTGKNLISLGASLNALDIVLGDGNDDGKNELIVGASNKQVYIVSYDNSTGSWASGSVGSGDGAMQGVDLGVARSNTSLTEVFAASADGHGYEFYYDRVPPANPTVTSDTHPTPGTWYDNNVVHVTWKDSGYDVSGIDGYNVTWDSTSDTVPGANKVYEENTHDATSSALADGGSYYFHIRARDNALNWNNTATHFGPIKIDTTAPDSLSLSINGGDAYTNSASVTLTVTATDPSPGSGIAKAAFSNDGTTWSGWEDYSASRANWDLTDSRYGANNSDGTKTVWAKVIDGVGHEIAANLRSSDSIFLDRVAPSGLSIVVNDGAAYATSADVSVKLAASDPDPASGLFRFALSNDGSAWSSWMDWSESASWSLVTGAGGTDTDGDRTVYLQVEDRATNVGGPVSDGIFLDRKAPENLSVKLNGGAAYTNSSSVDIAIDANDPIPGSTVSEMTVANAESSLGTWEAFASSKSGWSLVSGAGGTDADGSKTVYLKVRDKAQNTGGPVRGTIFLDRVKPSGASIVINGGAAYTTKATVDLTLKASDADPSSGIELMQLSTDGATWSDWEPFAASRAYTLNAPDGQKTVYFRVRDKALNVGDAASASIILDTAVPVISNVRVVSITDISAIITWTTDEEADSGVDYGLSSSYGSSKPDASFVTSHSVVLTGLVASTTYHFQVSSKDRAGNAPSFAGDYQFITAPTPDTTAPQISNVQATGITDVLAVVSWTTNEPADSAVLFGADTSYGQKGSDPNFVIKHSLTLLSLSPETIYHFQVQSTDPSGNGPASSADYTFTTLKTPDTVPPVISNVRVSGITDRLAVVTWETNEPADGGLDFGLTAAYGKSIGHPELASLHELTLLNLDPDTLYHFRLRATDASGNGPTLSEDFTFTTTGAPDNTPPSIQNLRAEGVSETTATVLWETDEIADAYLEYGTSAAYGISSTVNEYTLQHTLLLLGLKADTVYHVRVRSSDPSGNAGLSLDYTFRTKKGGAAQDLVPPVISGLEVTGVTNTRAVVIWLTDELANSEIEYGNSTAYGLRSSDPSYLMVHSIVLDNLLPSTEYHLRVKSTDVFGNGPSLSADIRFVTAAIADVEPPRITEVRVVFVTNNSVTINWVTNEPSTSRVEYGTTVAYGRNHTSPTYVLNHNVTIGNLTPETTYHFRVVSTDPSANPSLPSVDMTFTTPKATGGGGGGTTPKPTTKTEFPWAWLLLAIVLVAVVGLAAAFFVTRRKTPPASETTYTVDSETEALSPDEVAARIAGPGEETLEMLPMESAGAFAPAPSQSVPSHAASASPLATSMAGTASASSRPSVYSPAPASSQSPAYSQASAGIALSSAAAGAAAPAPEGVDWGAPMAGTPPARTPVKHIRCPACKTRIPIFDDVEQLLSCPVCGKKGPYRPKSGQSGNAGNTGTGEPVSRGAGEPGAPLFVHAPEPSPYAALDALVKTPREQPRHAQPAPLTVAPARRPAQQAQQPQPAQEPITRRTKCSNCGSPVPIYGNTFPMRVTCPNCGRSGTYNGPRK
jgi:ribosomal protein S27E